MVLTKPKLPNYDCTKCLAYCCSVYERVQVSKRDAHRLARYFNTDYDTAIRRFTVPYENERVLRRKADPVLGKACKFLDPKTRGCTIYEARPAVCREYPVQTRCAYYDLLEFEREQQDDQSVVPLIQITFRNGTK